MVKAPKDPNAPKKPLTPFFAFKAKVYNRVLKSMPNGYSIGQLTKKISAEWQSLPEAEKTAYSTTYAEQQKKYQKLFNAYKLTGNYQKQQLKLKDYKIEKSKKKGDTKFPKDENAPKKSPTAYFCFMSEKREGLKAQNPDLPHKELVKKMAKVWNDMSEEEKKPYVTEATKKKQAWTKAMEAYKKSDQFKEYEKAKAEHKQSLKTSAKKVKTPKAEKKSKKSKSPKKAKKSKKSPKKAKRKAVRKGAKKSPKKPKAPKKSSTKVSKSKKATKARKAKKKASTK